MGKFFEKLAEQLAEKWVALLLLPGVLFVAAAAVGARLGQAHAVDVTMLRAALAQATDFVGRQSGGVQVALAVAVLLVSSGVGLAVQALAGPTRRLWLGLWPGWAGRPLTGARQRRWQRRVDNRRTLENASPAAARTPEQQAAIDVAASRVNRVALAKPGRPTWMGDRVHAVERISHNRYGLDLAFGWPRLWLVLPDTARAEINAANAMLAAAVATGTWAWPYLVLGIFWWPALVIATAVGLAGWAKGRAAVADLGALSESAVDLYGRELAKSVGVGQADATGPLTIGEGEALTHIVRKGR